MLAAVRRDSVLALASFRCFGEAFALQWFQAWDVALLLRQNRGKV